MVWSGTGARLIQRPPGPLYTWWGFPLPCGLPVPLQLPKEAAGVGGQDFVSLGEQGLQPLGLNPAFVFGQPHQV